MKINRFLFVFAMTDAIRHGKSGEKRHPKEIATNDCSKMENVECERVYMYPNNDGEMLEKIQDMWENYYSCLKEKANRETKPEFYRLLEGQFIEFKCNICPRPFQEYEGVEWRYKMLSTDPNESEPEILDLTPEMELTGDMSLQIFNAIEEYSGIYVCYRGKNVVSVYFLEISKNDTVEKVETTEMRDKNFVNLKSPDFYTHYKWSPWTECSSCGKIGRKFKYGTCYVLNKRKSRQSDDDDCEYGSKRSIGNNARNSLGKTDIEPGKNLTNCENQTHERLIELIERFESGIPCFSSHITNSGFVTSIQQQPAVKVAVKRCLVDCPTPEIFKVINGFGRVIEVANNSAGIYSARQKIPKPPPDVDRRFVTADFGSDIIIQCPSTLHQNIPVTWKINKKTIFPEAVANESNGRFTIDLVNRIHLKKLRLRDNHIYSCWQREKLVGTVLLNVEKKFKFGFNHHVTLAAMLAMIATSLFLGVKFFARERKT